MSNDICLMTSNFKQWLILGIITVRIKSYNNNTTNNNNNNNNNIIIINNNNNNNNNNSLFQTHVHNA